jgi:hypothetical protein
MVLDKHRREADPFIAPVAKRFINVNPNTVSWLGLITALICGIVFYFSYDEHWLLLLGAALVLVSGYFDALDGRFDLIFGGRFYTLGYGNGASPAFSAEDALAFPLYRTEIMGKSAVVLTDSPLGPQEREMLVRRTADLTGSVPEVIEGTMRGSSGAFVFIPISFRFSEGS